MKNRYPAGKSLFRLSPTYGFKLCFLLFFFLSSTAPLVAQSIIWEKTYGGGANQDTSTATSYGRSQLTAIINTPDGGQIIGGKSNAEVGLDKTQPQIGKFDYWLVKINASGTKQWDQVIGGSGQEELSGIITTPDGGYLVGGISDSPAGNAKSENSKGGYDYWVVKLDSAGNKIWDKTLGSNNYDQLKAMIATADGGYLLAGNSNSGVGGNKTQAGNNNNDYWVVKLDSAGTVQWDKTFGSSNLEYLVNVVTTTDGGYLLAGEVDSVVYQKDGIRFTVQTRNFNALKITADGELQWNKTYYRPFNSPLKSFVTTPDRNYLFAGSNYLLKINESGTQLYEKNISSFLQAGKELEDVIATPDGGYLLGTNGFYSPDSQGNSRADDYRLVKLNSTGTFVWDSPYGGSGYDFLTKLTLTTDGNYLLGGYSARSNGIDKTDGIKGEIDYWVLKVREDVEPNLITWNQRFGGTDNDNLTQVIQTVDGGYLLGGYTLSNNTGDKSQASQGGYDYWVVKTDDKGNKLWERTYGGSSNDYLNTLLEIPDGRYLLGGSSESGISGDKTEANKGSRDFWVIQVNYKGDIIWDHTYGGSGFEDLRKVKALPSGDYLLGGISNSPATGDISQPNQGGQDFWLLQINDQGQKIWDRRYGGSANDFLEDILLSPDGGYVLGGTSNSGKTGDKGQASQGSSDYWVIKVNSTGAPIWNKRFGGSDQDNLFALSNLPGGRFLLAGQSSSGTSGHKTQPSRGDQDYWLIKIDGNGDKIWDKTFGGRSREELRSLAITRDGGFVLGGTSFSGRSGDKTQNSRGNSDYWLLKTDSTGTALWNYRFGGNGFDELRTTLLTQDGGLILGGRSTSGVSGDKTQPGWGNTDYWMVKLAATGVGIELSVAPSLAPEILLTAFPNPFPDKLTLKFKVPHTQNVSLQVYDQQGQPIANLFQGRALAGKTYELPWQPTPNITAGLYFIRLQTATQVTYRKVLLTR
ncbi:T9SS type A sorting domain-containing protein [Adhaeribacter swui]|uniref:T9SS type A sorting domain-containing protein n=1 Tax=Adhaeribacter swui TaxID=2086471 RepID=A0A7G7G487_9BACT|nr:T9SS type A sorting domain-containing protein [Adhaeribacter swui]QNF31971.1 T9SS type A sorting domain-containing protein [Adhaeribacter swui]